MPNPPRNDRGLRFGEGSVHVRSGTKVQARWNDGAKTRARTFTADTIDEARDMAEDFLRAMARERRSGRYVSPSDLTVTDILKEYQERGKQRWSTNTQATYGLLARKHIEPHIGKRRIIDLTPRILQLWIDTLAGTSLSPAVIENAKIVVSGACREAVQLGVIPVNPALGLRLPTRKKTEMPTWSGEDVRAVMTACEPDLWMRTFYTVALTTGMRPGELRALMWKDIDLEAARLQCRRSMTRDASFKAMVGDQTKSGRTRVIAIPGETVAALKALQQVQRTRRVAHIDWRATDIVFDGGNGAFVPLTTLENRHRAICSAATVERIRLHDLRHSFASIALASGANIKVISDILGHSSISITLDVYVHPNVEMHRSVVDSLGDLFFGNDVTPGFSSTNTINRLPVDAESGS